MLFVWTFLPGNLCAKFYIIYHNSLLKNSNQMFIGKLYHYFCLSFVLFEVLRPSHSYGHVKTGLLT